jgi:hypothetical protein
MSLRRRIERLEEFVPRWTDAQTAAFQRDLHLPLPAATPPEVLDEGLRRLIEVQRVCIECSRDEAEKSLAAFRDWAEIQQRLYGGNP